MNITLATKVLEYLKEKNMSFVWLDNGRFVTREDCQRIIGTRLENNGD